MLRVAVGAVKLQRKYTLAWFGWFLYFAIVEGLALRNPVPGDTLSEHGWSWGSFKGKARGWRWRRIAFLALLVWLAVHIVSGGYV